MAPYLRPSSSGSGQWQEQHQRRYTDNNDNISNNNNNNHLSRGINHWINPHIERVEVVISEDEETKDTDRPSQKKMAVLDESTQDLERWDDAFEFNSQKPFEQIFEQLQCHFPRSPLSDSSDQSDYFQPKEPLFKQNFIKSGSYASYTHALPTPPTTTTATTLTSSRSILSDGGRNTIMRPVSSTEGPAKINPRSFTALLHTARTTPNTNDTNTIKNYALPPLHPTSTLFRRRNTQDKAPFAASTDTSVYMDSKEQSSSTSPTCSTSSSPRAVTASVIAPSTITTSTGSLLYKDKSKDEDDNPTLSTKSMTTITQEMMLSNLPAYTGIITRINPIKRVADWVDDLEDLEVPEEDLNFSHVRSTLAKSPSVPETLESVDSWDTDSENSTSRSDDMLNVELPPRTTSPPTASFLSATPLLFSPSTASHFRLDDGSSDHMTAPQMRVTPETIETLDDDFDLPDDLGTLRLNLQARHQLQRFNSPDSEVSRKQPSLLQQWRDSGSDIDDFDFSTSLDNNSLSSSISFSRDSMAEDENMLDGIIIPDAMESLQLATIFGKEPRIQEDNFWDGLDIDGDDAFNHKGRNRNLVVRSVPVGREGGSRVQREVVPLKDFVALPSKIPRLCRAPGDTSRPVTPAPSLSRKHSTQLELPLRNLQSKSSLPRLKRSSVPRRDGARSSLILAASDFAVASSEGSSACSSAIASRAPTPTLSQFSGSKRNSLPPCKDDFPSFKSSSLAMRSVSFTEPSKAIQPEEAVESMQSVSSMQFPATSKQPSPQRDGKSFSTLRTLVKKLDLARPRFSARGLIPVFEPALPPKPENHSSAVPSLDGLPSVEFATNSRAELQRPPNSRSSSYTDWSSILASTETTKECRSPSRAGLVSLGDISEVSTTDLGEAATPVVAADRFSRRLFLKRSPKHSMFGDGSELDRFDNLPTFGVRETLVDERLRSTQLMVQVRRQSTDRVAAWLRKPQSIANLKDINKPAESEPSPPSKVRKSKSIRKSLFDIFGQTMTAEPTKEKTKKKRATNGPTLIRDLSQSRVRKVSGMVYNPSDKMWNGNDDILDEFESEEDAPTPSEFPSPQSAHNYFPTSPLLGASRLALISNMSQYSKQRTQVAGKMIFDPARMCWIVNPEYLARRRQRRQDDHRRQRSVDEAWGDEPDIFAGLSDSDQSQEDAEEDNDHERNQEATIFSNSLGRDKGDQLLSRHSIHRHSSQDYLAEEERLQAWAETMVPPSSNEPADSRPASAGVHAVVSKSSRKSFNGIHAVVSKSSRKSLNGANQGCCSNGIGGGGYSSRGEFEVGVEFDITDAFLEQCIMAEAQHRREAGKFFALPCTSIALDINAPAPGRFSRMTPSKMLTLGKKHGKPSTHGLEIEQERQKDIQRVEDKVGHTENVTEKKKGKERKTRAATVKIEIKDASFPTRPLLSWPPRSKSKSRSIVAHLLKSDGIELDRNLKPATPRGKEDQASGSNDIRDMRFGKTLPFASSYSSTSSAAPAAATLAARGRGGSHEVFFHRLPAKHDSTRGALSFAATLAVARRGAMSYDRRRIGDHTFDPLNKACIESGEDGAKKGNGSFDAAQYDEDGEDDFMERGYRFMTSARGRPPLRPRAELMLEFERHTGRRFQ
ncbi:hypothetical protein EDD21DRAFT_369359 [Dissophora ornata]|nr:hypothetical protein EDD21DRAFT_369359 [Dissophora ornata]